MNPIKELDHEVRNVHDIRVFVRQYVWPDGKSSYDVHLAPFQRLVRGSDGELTDLLTDESFDHMPSEHEIEQLPYIKPSVRREAPGVFFLLTGPYEKGPYPTRKEANDDIRAGRW